MRMFFTPHASGSLKVNFNAALNLFPKNGLAHRSSPFVDDGFERPGGDTGIIWEKSVGMRFVEFQDVYDRLHVWQRKMGLQDSNHEIPMIEDGKLLYDAFRAYIAEFLKALYGSGGACDEHLKADSPMQRWLESFFRSGEDSTPYFFPLHWKSAGGSCEILKDVLANLCFHVTGLHRHVGTVADYFRDTSFVATAWKEKEHWARPKNTIMMILLAATTNKQFPTVGGSDISEVFMGNTTLENLYLGLRASLEAVQKTVDRRNIDRVARGRLAFHQMSPRYVEWSVAV